MKKGRLFSLVLLMSVVSISMVGFPLTAQSQVTLNIEDSSGIPGSSDNLVEVSLTNLSDEVKGISLEVCDVDNYLTCTGCEPTGRAPSGFECIYSNLANGCVKVILVNLDNTDMIGVGDGPIFTIEYDVSGVAPSEECRDLNPEEVSVLSINVSGELFKLDATLDPGEFCFYDCTSNQDCDDGLFCNGEESCVNGACQPGEYPCTEEPYFFCNEETDGCEEGPASVVLTVGEGLGVPGSSNNPVGVSLTNLGDKVKSIWMEVCDVDNHLTCTGCVPTGRTPFGFKCFFKLSHLIIS